MYFSEVDPKAGFDKETKGATGAVTNYSGIKECYTLTTQGKWSLSAEGWCVDRI